MADRNNMFAGGETADAFSAEAPHALDQAEVATLLESDIESGIAAGVAASRLQTHGPNVLEAHRLTPWYVILARQFRNTLIIILLIAAAIAALVGEIGDSLTILAIIVLNGVLGFVQEWKAEQAMAALQRMLAPRCMVVREGHQQEIDARELVPGDLVRLEIGDRVPADLRLIDTTNMKADESALTGESVAVRKDPAPVAPDTPLAERSSMAWMGTSVTNGRAHGLVVATGMSTQFGRVAELAGSVGNEPTPLQRKLAKLARQLGMASILISVGVVLSGWLLGKSPLEMFMTGISLAVAIVPEGLPAVVTVTLALGIRTMARRRALLRRLQAAETLGSATVICTDKTGTLTQNEMTATRVWMPGADIEIGGVGYAPHGDFNSDGHPLSDSLLSSLRRTLRSAMICNHATVRLEQNDWRALGAPTEAALVTAALKAGLDPHEMPRGGAEFSFDSNRKRMTVVADEDGTTVAHVKGAPEVIVDLCGHLLDGDESRAMTASDRASATAAYTRLAESGLRTLAIARRELESNQPVEQEIVEQNLTLLGIVGMIDPARPEAATAISTAKSAGISVVMITGDAADTALAVARQIGLGASLAITGSELAAMDDAALSAALAEQAVFARTTPEHKMRIVSLLQGQGQIVGMTGDGVNDAPALKKADIGIAMGQRGTDVARSASDMVLTDDNFATIIAAVEEGRRQYDNIRKFVRYLLSSNAGEVVAIFLNILVGGPLIFLPVQILWMNLVTDGMTALALGVEPAERDLMKRSPRVPDEPILDRAGFLMVALLGGYIGLVTLFLFHVYRGAGDPGSLALAQTMAFTAIIVMEKVNVFNFRSLSQPLASVGFFSNPWILLAWLATVGLQVAVVYTPFLQQALHTTALGWRDWGLIALVAAPVFILAEVAKYIREAKRPVRSNSS